MSAISHYKVVKGDTLFAIAKKFKMTVDDLKSLNGLASNNLNIGQVLKVRVEGPAATPPPASSNSSSSSGGSATQPYKVVKGDTLFGIAKKFGMTVDALKSLNGLTSNNLSVGQTLRVRGSSPTPPAKPQPPTPAQPDPPPVSGNFLTARRQFVLETRQEAGFRRYFLTVPLPNGGSVVANMRDHVNSQFMLYPLGIMYAGQSHMEISLSAIQAVGLTPVQAAALQFVSTHEGSFDAINSYDKAIFSYGFIQFTGAAAVGGSLNRLLAGMEANAPAAFRDVFGRVGIDTEGTGKNATVTVLDDTGFKRRGDEAWLYIQGNVPLYGAFIQAGFEPSLVREQLRAANELYVQPALNFKLDVTIGGIRLSIPRISDILTSEAAMTLIIALAINKGTGGMSQIVAPAVSAVASQQRLQSAVALRQIDQRRVFETVLANTTDTRVRDRVNGVFNSGMSFG
ncbi:MAG: LysM peptidoglycan-binding domain-containing protein [Lewinellaceae bacterium]|nr:LysM peptidoglycan-binding domain-containing protein [Lewinellaceae bacterium]